MGVMLLLMDSQPWTRKHQPKKTGDVVGQAGAIRSLREFMAGYKNSKKKVMLIYGPPGCGKTSSVYAAANEFGMEVLEINASDTRNQKAITETIGPALKQQSLFSRSKVILIDELDGISGTKDRGGVAALSRLLSESAFPVVITANNPFDRKFSSLRKKAELVEFSPLSYKDVKEVIGRICRHEGIGCSADEISSFARRTAGDLRGAITDMQVMCQETRQLTKDDVAWLSGRNRQEDIKAALLRIFRNSDLKIAVEAMKNINEDIDEAFLWIDENLPYEYTEPESLASAYDSVSKADVFRGRIKRWQYWRFLAYINDFLTGGVAVSKKQKNPSVARYKPSSRILKLYIAKMRYMKRRAIAQKLAEKTHSSAKQSVKSLPYLRIVFQKGKGGGIAEELELDKEEVEWLKN